MALRVLRVRQRRQAAESEESAKKLDPGRIEDCLAWSEIAQRKANDIFPSWSGERGRHWIQ